MLAHKWTGQDPIGWYMSEKLDGMRAFWTGRELLTRNNNLIAAPRWFLDALPYNVALDGELWLGRGRFQDLVSIARRQDPDDTAWRKVRYLIFAMPDLQGPFRKQVEEIPLQVTRMRLSWYREGPGGEFPVEAVEQVLCTGLAHLPRFHSAIKKKGGEGVMLRTATSEYERKRSHELLKVKDFLDGEAEVLGTYAGEGKHLGRIGGYRCRLLSNDARFEVGTGLSDKERERPLKAGSIIVVKYQNLSDSGNPRFPVYVGLRGD